MTTYTGTITKDSAALPGVRFTIREISEGVRRRLRREIAPAMAKIADLEVEREEFYERIAARLGKPADEIKLAELTLRERREFDSINARIDEINDCDVHPAYFLAGYFGVEGLKLGLMSEFSGAELLECGPPALVREITRAITRGAQLDDAEKANLDSPSTSPAVVVGKTSDTNADPANVPAGTSPVTASGWALKD